jgi:hypothetical protein
MDRLPFSGINEIGDQVKELAMLSKVISLHGYESEVIPLASVNRRLVGGQKDRVYYVFFAEVRGRAVLKRAGIRKETEVTWFGILKHMPRCQNQMPLSPKSRASRAELLPVRPAVRSRVCSDYSDAVND